MLKVILLCLIVSASALPVRDTSFLALDDEQGSDAFIGLFDSQDGKTGTNTANFMLLDDEEGSDAFLQIPGQRPATSSFLLLDDEEYAGSEAFLQKDQKIKNDRATYSSFLLLSDVDCSSCTLTGGKCTSDDQDKKAECEKCKVEDGKCTGEGQQEDQQPDCSPCMVNTAKDDECTSDDEGKKEYCKSKCKVDDKCGQQTEGTATKGTATDQGPAAAGNDKKEFQCSACSQKDSTNNCTSEDENQTDCEAKCEWKKDICQDKQGESSPPSTKEDSKKEGSNKEDPEKAA